MTKIGTRRTLAPAARQAPARVPDAALLLGALPMPVVLLDSEDRFRFVNPAAEQFFGVSQAQLAQMRLADLVPPDNPLFMLLSHARSGEGHDLRPRPRAGGPAAAQARHHGAGDQPAGGAGLAAAGVPGRIDGPRAGPAAQLPGRGAQRQRHGGDHGARGEEPAVRHPRRGPAAGGQRERAGPRAVRADPRGGGPHPRAGGPHGGVRRRADRARPGQHPPACWSTSAGWPSPASRRTSASPRRTTPRCRPCWATATS